jgi:hypothetical protein
VDLEAHLDNTILHSFFTLQHRRRVSQPPPAQSPVANRAQIHAQNSRNSRFYTHIPIYISLHSLKSLFLHPKNIILRKNAAPIRYPLRCAPVVSLHSQPSLLDASSLRQRISIRQWPSRYLPRTSIFVTWIPKPVTVPIQAKTSPKSSSHQRSAPLTTDAQQGRTTCITTTNTSSNHTRFHTTTASICACARRQQAPTLLRG